MAPKYKMTVKRWDAMFERTVRENELRDERLDQDLGQTAFSLTRGTVSSPLTQVGKYRLGRAFLTNSPELEKTKAFIESNWPGNWKNVVSEVEGWLNPKEPERPLPVLDRRRYMLPCGHKKYHFDPGPRGLITCYTPGCHGVWKPTTDNQGRVKMIEISKPSGKP
jgi:hypothetical protein